MKQNIVKITAAAIALGLCAVGLSVPACAETESSTDTVYFYDEAGVLSDAEFDEAMSALEETAAYTGMNIGVWIGGEPLGSGEKSTIAFCDDTYDELYGINTDGVFLYLDFSGEDDLFDYLSTSGSGQLYYTNSDAENRVGDIISDTESYLERGNEDTPSALDAFCEDMKSYYDDGVPSGYYTYNSDTGMYLIWQDGKAVETETLPEGYTAELGWGTIALVAVLIGLVAGGISLLCIHKRYQFKNAGSMRNYLENGNVHYTQREDRFLRQHQSRTKISSDSSSGGGGGSSHSSSSGGSHGGGGGHR